MGKRFTLLRDGIIYGVIFGINIFMGQVIRDIFIIVLRFMGMGDQGTKPFLRAKKSARFLVYKEV